MITVLPVNAERLAATAPPPAAAAPVGVGGGETRGLADCTLGGGLDGGSGSSDSGCMLADMSAFSSSVASGVGCSTPDSRQPVLPRGGSAGGRREFLCFDVSTS